MSDIPNRRRLKVGSDFVTTVVLCTAVFAVLFGLISTGAIPAPNLPHFFG
jgi:hypothetical protein